MKSRLTMLPIALVALAAMGCNKSNESASAPAAPATSPAATTAPSPPASDFVGSPASEADAKRIYQAVEDHVRNDQGIKLSAMDMSVDSASVNGDRAQAITTFSVKQGGASMAMAYDLERHANGWIVVKGRPAEGQYVHPPLDKTHSGTRANSSAPATMSTSRSVRSPRRIPPRGAGSA